MESFLEKYNDLPEWLRWMLFIPISILGAVLWTLFIALSFFLGVDRQWAIREQYALFLNEIVGHAIFYGGSLWIIFYLIPRWKLNTIILLISLRTMLSCFIILLPVYLLIVGKMPEINIVSWEYLKVIISESIVLGVSIISFLELRRNTN